MKHLYIDDPISSLDEHNAITVASHLAQMLEGEGNRLKTVISTHHPLFFNVLWNEFKNANKYLLSRTATSGSYELREACDTPYFHHVASIVCDVLHRHASGVAFDFPPMLVGIDDLLDVLVSQDVLPQTLRGGPLRALVRAPLQHAAQRDGKSRKSTSKRRTSA